MVAANPNIARTLFVILVLSSLAAGAENKPLVLTVSGENVNVVLPEGACAYNGTNPIDAQVLDNLEKANKGVSDVVLAFAGCKDIEAMRDGKLSPPTNDFGQIMSPIGGDKVRDYTRAEFVSKAADGYKDAGFFEEGTEKAADILREVTSRRLDGSSPVMLGVIRKDPDFIEVAMLQGLPDNEKVLPLTTVATTTKLGVPVTINFYHIYTDEASLSALASRAAVYTRQLVALNPDKPGLPASHALALAREEEESSMWFFFKSNWQVIALAGVIGSGIGAIYQFGWKLKKRKSKP